jgi:hypothetical protein
MALVTLRLDEKTDTILNNLVTDFNFNKSQIMRQSIRLMNELKELKKQHGEIILNVGNREIFVLIG